MGFFGGGDAKTENVTTTTPNVPEWLKGYFESNIGNLANATARNQGLTADQAIVGFNKDDQAAFDRARSQVGRFDPAIDSSLGVLEQVQQRNLDGYSIGDIQGQMNPYQQSVTDITKRELTRDADIQRQAIGDSAIQAGAFGGGRHGVMEGMLNRDTLQQLSDIQYTGDRDAYNQAYSNLQNMDARAASNAGAISNLATQGQNIAGTDTQSLAAVGDSIRGLDQTQTDFTYNNDVNQFTNFQNALNSINTGMYGTTTNQTSTESGGGGGWGSKLLGAGLTAFGTAVGGPAGGAVANTLGSSLTKAEGGPIRREDLEDPSKTSPQAQGVPQNYFDGGAILKAAIPVFAKELGGSLTGNGTQQQAQQGPLNHLQSPEFQSQLIELIKSNTNADNELRQNYFFGGAVQKAIEFVQKGAPGTIERVGGPSGHALTKLTPLLANTAAQKLDASVEQAPQQDALVASTTPTAPTPQAPQSALEQAIQGGDTSSELQRTIAMPNAIPTPPIEVGEGTPKSMRDKINDRLRERANDPLVQMGLNLMASDKPFFEAIGEAGLATAQGISATKKAEQEALQAQQEAIAAAQQQAIENQRNQKVLEINQQKADAYTRQVENMLSKPTKDKMSDIDKITLKVQVESISNNLNLSEEERMAQIQALAAQYEGLTPAPNTTGNQIFDLDDYDPSAQ